MTWNPLIDESDAAYLVGQTILAIYISDMRLCFITDEGPVVFIVEGDCCSWSYFYSFWGAGNLIDQRVTALTPVRLPDPCDADSALGDVVDAYGFAIESTGGDAELSFRNDSNGYYGGYMRYDAEAPTSFDLSVDNGWTPVFTNYTRALDKKRGGNEKRPW
jgi:hypothetical protein